MNKYILLLFVSIFYFESSFSQAGVWTWVSGDSIPGTPGVYGTQGIPSMNNHPPAVYEPCEWKDKLGNFWVYGGWLPSYSDLWKYNPGTNEWTWMKGNGLASLLPVYGTQGVSSPANTPGERYSCATTWVDTAGNLWLFGGNHWNNDLWKYNISSNEWTWVTGDTILNSPGVHGTQGIPSALNIPGARCETSSAWTDSLNNLWLFGGLGFDNGGANGFLNDLMKYDISTNEWTWMSGSADTTTFNNYGIRGVTNASNVPGGRCTYIKWKDLQDKFWVMGGDNYNYYNDVWKYDWGTNYWTWMAGTNLPNDAGNYQAMCIFDTINMPAAKHEQRSAVTDNCGRFWLFGGHYTGINETLNDTWVFDPLKLKWNWLSGTNVPNQAGNHGILGVASAANIPTSRQGAVAWWGNDNRLYMFGGYMFYWPNYFSDLWVFDPDTSCIRSCDIYPVAVFTSPSPICPGTCTSFLNLSINATSFQWSFSGGTPSTSTDVNPQNICYTGPGSYDVQLIASNANGSDTLTLNNFITVYPYPPPQSITQNGDTLFGIPGATSYQWYFNGNIVNGATDYFYVAQMSGDYNVVATDANGCEVEAAMFNVVASAQAEIGSGSIHVFPNPVSDKVTIHPDSYRELKVTSGTAIEISVYNIMGEIIWNGQPESGSKTEDVTVDVSGFVPGLYWIEIGSDEKKFRAKFIKQ